MKSECKIGQWRYYTKYRLATLLHRHFRRRALCSPARWYMWNFFFSRAAESRAIMNFCMRCIMSPENHQKIWKFKKKKSRIPSQKLPFPPPQKTPSLLQRRWWICPPLGSTALGVIVGIVVGVTVAAVTRTTTPEHVGGGSVILELLTGAQSTPHLDSIRSTMARAHYWWIH